MRSTVLSPLLVAAACTALGACAGVKTQSTTGSGGTNGGVDGSVGPNQDANVSFDFGTPDIMIAPPHSECGDGTRSQDEACDDHNVTGGDGCAADCLTVDPGYSCQPPGMPCHRIARCGDGVVRAARAVRRQQRDRRGRLLGDLQDRDRVEVQRQPEHVLAHDLRRPENGRRRRVRRRQRAAVRRLLGRLPERARLQDRSKRLVHVALRGRHRRQRSVRRRQQRRRRRVLGHLQDRARVHVQAAGARRHDGGSGRLSRLPRQDAQRRLRAAGRDGADDGAHRDGQAGPGRGGQARLRGQRRQQLRHLRRRRSRSGTATRRA